MVTYNDRPIVIENNQINNEDESEQIISKRWGKNRVHLYCWDLHSEVMGCEGSPVRLGIVGAQLLPQDPVTSWSGQKAALPLCSAPELHFLNLNSNLRR